MVWHRLAKVFVACMVMAGTAVWSAAAQQPPATQPAASGLVPLELTLPRPAYTGTPKVIPPGSTVEQPSDKPRETFYVPPGAKNVALGLRVDSSDREPIIGDLSQITDGNKEGSEGNWVELGPGLQWVQLDLGQNHSIYAIVLWHFHGDPRVYRDVVVQAADDPDFIMNVRTLFNNDQDNSSGLGLGKDREYYETHEGKLMDTKGIKARYLRFYSNGNTADDQNHYTEIEVYGIPAN
jgi:hypothetical protein